MQSELGDFRPICLFLGRADACFGKAVKSPAVLCDLTGWTETSWMTLKITDAFIKKYGGTNCRMTQADNSYNSSSGQRGE